MSTTQTQFSHLLKPAKGDKAWDVPANTSWDMVDRFVAASGYGDPNLVVNGRAIPAVEFNGQKWFRIDVGVHYFGLVGQGWFREVPRGVVAGYTGAIAGIAQLYGWRLADGSTVNLMDNLSNPTEAAIVLPNMGGRIFQGYLAADPDYGTVGTLFGDVNGKVTLVKENIPSFDLQVIESAHNHGVGVTKATGNPSGVIVHAPGSGGSTTDIASTGIVVKTNNGTYVQTDVDIRQAYIVGGWIYRL